MNCLFSQEVKCEECAVVHVCKKQLRDQSFRLSGRYPRVYRQGQLEVEALSYQVTDCPKPSGANKGKTPSKLLYLLLFIGIYLLAGSPPANAFTESGFCIGMDCMKRIDKSVDDRRREQEQRDRACRVAVLVWGECLNEPGKFFWVTDRSICGSASENLLEERVKKAFREESLQRCGGCKPVNGRVERYHGTWSR